MSLIHHILAGALRAAGRTRDAQEVEAAAAWAAPRRKSEPAAYEPTASAISNAPRGTLGMPGTPGTPGTDGRAVAGSGSATLGAANGPSASAAGSAQAGESAGSRINGSRNSSGDASLDVGGQHADGGEHESPANEHSNHAGALPDAAHDISGVDPRDPLRGLFSDRLKHNLEREAFRTASRAAQDSEIVAKTYRRHVPPELRPHLTAELSPAFTDTAPATRATRIAALAGEIPIWARGDPQNDPRLLQAAERGQTHAQHGSLSAAQHAQPHHSAHRTASHHDTGRER